MTSIEGRREIAGSQRWVVGHDGSDGADRAIAWTLTQAIGRPTTVEVLHVCHPATPVTASSPSSTTADRVPAQIRADLDAVVARFHAVDVESDARIVGGGPAQMLLEAGEDAALLVVGSRGRGGFRRLLLGSVSHQCAAYSQTPIVVVPATASADTPIRHIVVGVDGSEPSIAAMTWALSFAPRDATFEVVGAWSESRMGSIAMMQDLSDDRGYTRQTFHDLLDAIDPELIGERSVQRRFVREQPTTALLAAATGADLLVVGQRGRSGLSAAILGSVATHVLHHSPTPVAVIPSEPIPAPLETTTVTS